MNPTPKLGAVSISQRIGLNFDAGQVTWEYRFADIDESISALKETTTDGWIVVSSSIRHDKRRQYLLKRQRR